MKVAVAGASGQVGRLLIPELRDRGHTVLAIGRDTSVLSALFPEVNVCTYSEIEKAAAGFDLVLNLAAVNNNSELTARDFQNINADFALRLQSQCSTAGVRRYVYFSSFHALDDLNNSLYAVSKRAGANQLQDLKSAEVAVLYLPAVYGRRWLGRLSFLNNLPRHFVAEPVFRLIAALKPTVCVARIGGFLERLDAEKAPRFRYTLADNVDLNPVYRTVTRALDLAMAAAVLCGFFWLMLLISALIRLDTNGPAVFRQWRVGKEGRRFRCLKFRTMHLGTEESATHFVSANRVTRVGKILRSSKLDELPQCWNVLRGDMSFVGPRPCLPSQLALIEARKAEGVDMVLPGITGWAQINGVDMSEPGRLARVDAEYLAMRGLIFHMKILFCTLFGAGGGDRIGPKKRLPSLDRVN